MPLSGKNFGQMLHRDHCVRTWSCRQIFVSQFWPEFVDFVILNQDPILLNPTSIYNASLVKIYNATDSLARF
jgi:hypothetical protein